MKKIEDKVKRIMLFIKRDLPRVSEKSFKRQYDKKVIWVTR